MSNSGSKSAARMECIEVPTIPHLEMLRLAAMVHSADYERRIYVGRCRFTNRPISFALQFDSEGQPNLKASHCLEGPEHQYAEDVR